MPSDWIDAETFSNHLIKVYKSDTSTVLYLESNY